MFTQIASDCLERGSAFSYFCVGIQKSANTVSLFRTAEDLKVGGVLAKDMENGSIGLVKEKLDAFVAGNDSIYVTICADVSSSAFARSGRFIGLRTPSSCMNPFYPPKMAQAPRPA